MSPTMASAMKVITIDHTRSIDPGDIVHDHARGVVSSALWRALERLLKASRSSSGSAMKGLSLPGQPSDCAQCSPMSRSP